jgi:hypothetical protein
MKRDSLRQKIQMAIREFVRRYGRGRRGEPEQPEDPYSYVTAPKRPRPNQGSASAVADLPED